MKTKLGNSILGLFLLVAAFSASAAVAELKPVKLPKPVTSGGMPLMEALAKRSTSRSFSGKELSPQMLSNLLWAAFGINRPDGKRTAPSAMNWQEISIYVATKDGVYLYDAAGNVLQPGADGDQRAKTGMQQQAAQSPVSLIFVADFGKTKQVQKDDK
ncbi:MAG TPA: nitroreductase family protein, partial [bacterium]|nr:nitroreductase family protein [bacterium]